MLGSAKDIPAPKQLDELDWSAAERVESLARLKAYVARHGANAVEYYQFAKKPKKRWAIWLRMAALLFAGAAGLIPILSQLFMTENGTPYVQPAWASVALALAAGALAIDRFFGFSSGWMRFMVTELKARRALDDFELEWEATRASWADTAPSAEQVQDMIARATRFAGTVADIVRDETDQWMSEFREAIRQLDERSKAVISEDRRGAVRVHVTNGDQAAEGWDLSVDDGPGRPHRGRTAALNSLLPGLHVIRVRARSNGAVLEGESPVAVAQGEVSEVEVTLT
jgi:ABC-type multidrug transport system fused ATPase/permease subunit